MTIACCIILKSRILSSKCPVAGHGLAWEKMPSSEKISQIFHRNILSNFLGLSDVFFRNFKWFYKLIVFFSEQTLRVWACNNIAQLSTLKNSRLWSHCRARPRWTNVPKMPPKNSYKPIAYIRGRFWNFRFFQKWLSLHVPYQNILTLYYIVVCTSLEDLSTKKPN